MKQSHTKMGTYEWVDDVKHLQENDEAGIIFLDESNEKTRNDNQKPGISKQSRHENISDFIIS